MVWLKHMGHRMQRELRRDIAVLEPVTKHVDDDGFLRARLKMAKPGVFNYFRGNGISLEAKLPEEILSISTMDSAKRSPIADGHPPISDCDGLITPDNYSKYIKGSLGDSITIQNGYLVGEETVFDKTLAEDIKSGKKAEVSIGFTADIDPTPGEYNGEHYDVAQRNIRINHIAHVEKGRAGSDVKAFFDTSESDGVPVTRLDSRVSDTNQINQTKNNEGETMDMDENSLIEKITAAIKSIFSDKKKGNSETLDQQEGTADFEKEKLLKENEALKAKLAENEKKMEERQDALELDSKIEERLEIMKMAHSVLDSFDSKSLSNQEIKLKVIEKVLPFSNSVRIDSLDDMMIDARYDASFELAKERAMQSEHLPASSGGVYLDENLILKKRAERLNLFDQIEAEATKGGIL